MDIFGVIALLAAAFGLLLGSLRLASRLRSVESGGKLYASHPASSRLIEGRTVNTAYAVINGREYMRVTINAQGLLPPPLEIVKRDPSLPEAGADPDVVALTNADFEALNHAIGSELLDRVLAYKLNALQGASESFRISSEGLSVLVPGAGSLAQGLSVVQEAAAWLAGRLAEAARAADLRLAILCHRIRSSREFNERRSSLKRLLHYYNREYPPVRELLEWLQRQADFELAFLGTEALGRDTAQFLFSVLEKGGPGAKAAAVKKIGELKLTGAIDFLTAYFRKTRFTAVQVEIVIALKKFEDPKTEPLFLEALAAEFYTLKMAAIEALAAGGGPAALAPLHAVTEDTSFPAVYRNAAENAMASIRARLGKGTEGLLSIAGSGDDTGGLSLVGADEGGNLSLADKKEKGDAPGVANRQKDIS